VIVAFVVAAQLSTSPFDRQAQAAESVREGLDEALTVLTLNLSARLRRSLATTNAAEASSAARVT
jgi:hypothetical protein